ncbi:unnamed protein product [Gadus morhua 'NCC']
MEVGVKNQKHTLSFFVVCEREKIKGTNSLRDWLRTITTSPPPATYPTITSVKTPRSPPPQLCCPETTTHLIIHVYPSVSPTFSLSFSLSVSPSQPLPFSLSLSLSLSPSFSLSLPVFLSLSLFQSLPFFVSLSLF